MERVTGIEPALKAWEALILPLNYTRFTKEQSTIKNMIKSIKKLVSSHKQKTSLFCREVFYMGRMIGFEPTTPGTTNRCSNQLSYIRHRLYEFLQNIFASVKQNINDETIYLYLLSFPVLRFYVCCILLLFLFHCIRSYRLYKSFP